MKPLQPLLLFALLITLAAWLSLQGISQATSLSSPEVPMAIVEVQEQQPTMVAHISSAVKKPVLPKASDPKVPGPLQIALQAADLCETAKLLQGSISTQDTLAAILAVIEPSPTLLEAYGPNGPMLATKVPDTDDPSANQVKFASSAARLLWALKMGGQLYGPVSAPSENPKAARALLLELGKKQPGNAVYPFFRLSVEEKLGYTREQLKETAQEIASSSIFDTHFSELDREMRDASLSNPAVHYALSYVYNPDIFTYYGPVSLLQRLAREGDFDGDKRVARLMTEQALHASRPSSSGEFDASQFSTGRLLDPSGYKNFSELEMEKGHTKPRHAPSIFAEQEGLQRCDPGPYEAYFYEARSTR